VHCMQHAIHNRSLVRPECVPTCCDFGWPHGVAAGLLCLCQKLPLHSTRICRDLRTIGVAGSQWLAMCMRH